MCYCIVYSTALYGESFPDRSEGAYSNYNVWFGFGSAAAYAYSDYLCTDVKVYIVIGSILFAMLCYIISIIIDREQRQNTMEDDKKALCDPNVKIINPTVS